MSQRQTQTIPFVWRASRRNGAEHPPFPILSLSMRDSDVRAAVRELLYRRYAHDDDTRVVEEMGVWSGSARIDIAVINGELCGYELKSDSDTLSRLPSQIDLYNRVFDRVVLVAGSRHADKVAILIPEWWGIVIARGEGAAVTLCEARAAAVNPAPEPYLVAQLLWRDEALAELEARGLAKGVRSKPAREVHERLVAALPFGELSAVVRSALKRRQNWLGQSVGDQRKVPIGGDFDPASAVT